MRSRGAYARALAEAVRSKSVARSAEQIVDEIRLAYPFHPSVKRVVALFKENESYRQTRGLMLFASKMLKSVWTREADGVLGDLGPNGLAGGSARRIRGAR